jgi:hypothetical protein
VSRRVAVAVEAASRKAFATAVDWPGWSRSGKTPELALEALAASAPRYAAVAELAGEPFPSGVRAGSFEVVEEAEGGSGTEFGVPSRVTDADRRPVSASGADRLRRLVAAAWDTFDRVAAHAPAELRKGPRGGGRDRDKMIGHVVEADYAYAREIGLRLKPTSVGDRPAIESVRAAILEVIGAPSDGSPIAGRRWTPRYAASRIAWHSLDHAWEMEDRSEPA